MKVTLPGLAQLLQQRTRGERVCSDDVMRTISQWAVGGRGLELSGLIAILLLLEGQKLTLADAQGISARRKHLSLLQQNTTWTCLTSTGSKLCNGRVKMRDLNKSYSTPHNLDMFSVQSDSTPV